MTAPVEPTGLGAVAIRSYEGVTAWAVRSRRDAYPWLVNGRDWTNWNSWTETGDVEVIHPGVGVDRLTRPAEPTEPGTIRDVAEDNGVWLMRVLRTRTGWRSSSGERITWEDIVLFAKDDGLAIVDPFAPAGGAS